MNTNAPKIVLVGRNSADLKKYRSEISHFDVTLLNSVTEISSLDSVSMVFIDEMSLKDINISHEVPITVIVGPRIESEDNKIDFGDISARFRVLKRPLIKGEILHEVENVLQTIQSGRLGAIREMLKGLTHELGNIVLRIMGRTDLALMSDDVEKIHCELKNIMKTSLQASELVKSLRAFAKSMPDLSAGHLSRPVEDALKRLEEGFSAHKVTIHLEGLLKTPESQPKMVFDQVGMTQVFFNLFENALHAMQSGGEMWVKMTELRSPKHAIEIKIRDSGEGMPPDVLKRAFDVAFSTRKGAASGLGLSIAHELILNHRGRIHLKSKEGKGTEISIWLPVTLNL
jgi:signal transduction histidine kinase